MEWPLREPLVWAELYSSSRIADKVDSDFVISNTPPGHKVLFAAPTRNGHNEMVKVLAGEQDSFEIRTLGLRVPAGNSMTRRLFGRKHDVEILFGSTRRSEVVEKVFDHYFLDWASTFVFPFLVARAEPTDWKRIIGNMIGNPPRIVPQELVRQCRCIMATTWDHGMILVSDKIPEAEIEGIARRIASKHQVGVRVTKMR